MCKKVLITPMLLDNASPHCTIASRILIAGVLTDVPGYLKKSKKPQNQLTSFCEIIRPVSGGGGGKGRGLDCKLPQKNPVVAKPLKTVSLEQSGAYMHLRLHPAIKRSLLGSTQSGLPRERMYLVSQRLMENFLLHYFTSNPAPCSAALALARLSHSP